jgi:acetylornithine deacetylase/succinyl-diaminopimelate desuccinylase-like protein
MTTNGPWAEDHSGEVAELLAALIQDSCVNDGSPDSGNEHRAVATIEGYLGTPDVTFEPHPGRNSALYRIPGSDPAAPSLMLMGHTDVVPVSPDGWSVDPFAGSRSDGFVWGRGAVDMLNVTSAMAAVFKRHRSGTAPRLPGDLLFLAVADEEAAGTLGARWLVDNEWDAVKTDYLLTEIGTPMLPGGKAPGLPVTVAEKGPQWRRIVGRGQPGHGSQPYGTANALLPVAEVISRLASSPAPVIISDEWRRFVEAWGPGEIADELLDPDRVDDAIDRLAFDDIGLARWIHACTHLTVSPNVVTAGVKANVVPDFAEAEIDVRSLPGQEAADVDDHFRKAIGPALAEEVEIITMEATAASGSPPAGPLWDAIGTALGALRPDAHLVPSLIPVGTDARFFRRKGTTAYGVGLFDDAVAFGDFLRMFHGHDERVSERSLGLTTSLLGMTVDAFGENV